MRGAHRGPGGASAWKNARWLAVLVGLVLAVPALVAGLIWFFANATDLELSAFVLILATAALIKALAQGKPDMIWVSVGGVVGFGWDVMRDVTHHPGGSLAEYVVRAVAIVCALIGIAKADGLGWVLRAIRRLAPGSGGDGSAGPG